MQIRLEMFQLRDPVESWWRSIKDSRDITDMTWEGFCQLFLERHFLAVISDRKRPEFIKLIQGNMTVSEYEVKFTALSRCAYSCSSHLKAVSKVCRQIALFR